MHTLQDAQSQVRLRLLHAHRERWLPGELSAAVERLVMADSVEKLGRRAHRCLAAKIDLSDRPRIDDHGPGNGLTTPANVPKRTPLEFFNRIGRTVPLEPTSEDTQIAWPVGRKAFMLNPFF